MCSSSTIRLMALLLLCLLAAGQGSWSSEGLVGLPGDEERRDLGGGRGSDDIVPPTPDVVIVTRKPSARPRTLSPSTLRPSQTPSLDPSPSPSLRPSSLPSPAPTHMPSPLAGTPTRFPTMPLPSAWPTASPSLTPTFLTTPKPSPAPTYLITLRPTTQPTGTPSWRPTARPTSYPTSYPTAFPTLRSVAGVNGTMFRQALGVGDLDKTDYTYSYVTPMTAFKRLGHSRRYYLSVDVAATGFGDGGISTSQYVSIYYSKECPGGKSSKCVKDKNNILIPLCSPGRICSRNWVRCYNSTNIDVSPFLSSAHGGSLYLWAATTGVTTVPPSCPKRVSASNYALAVSFTLSQHGQPTPAPSPSPTSVIVTTSMDILGIVTHNGVPYYIVVLVTVLFTALAFVLIRIREKSVAAMVTVHRDASINSILEQTRKQIPLAKVGLFKSCFQLGLVGSGVISDFFVIYALLSRENGRVVGSDTLFTCGMLMLGARVGHAIPSIAILGMLLGPQHAQDGNGRDRNQTVATPLTQEEWVRLEEKALRESKKPIKRLVDLMSVKVVIANSKLFGGLSLLSMLDVTLLRLLPWYASPFSAAADGYPTVLVFSTCVTFKFVQSCVSLAAQIVFITLALEEQQQQQQQQQQNSSNSNGAGSSTSSNSTAFVFLIINIFSTTALLGLSLLDILLKTRLLLSLDPPTPQSLGKTSRNELDHLSASRNPLSMRFDSSPTASQYVSKQELQELLGDLERRIEAALQEADYPSLQMQMQAQMQMQESPTRSSSPPLPPGPPPLPPALRHANISSPSLLGFYGSNNRGGGGGGRKVDSIPRLSSAPADDSSGVTAFGRVRHPTFSSPLSSHEEEEEASAGL